MGAFYRLRKVQSRGVDHSNSTPSIDTPQPSALGFLHRRPNDIMKSHTLAGAHGDVGGAREGGRAGEGGSEPYWKGYKESARFRSFCAVLVFGAFVCSDLLDPFSAVGSRLDMHINEHIDVRPPSLR